MPLKPADGSITLRLLVDRGSLETFGNNGRVVDTECWAPTVTPRPSGSPTTAGN